MKLIAAIAAINTSRFVNVIFSPFIMPPLLILAGVTRPSNSTPMQRYRLRRCHPMIIFYPPSTAETLYFLLGCGMLYPCIYRMKNPSRINRIDMNTYGRSHRQSFDPRQFFPPVNVGLQNHFHGIQSSPFQVSLKVLPVLFPVFSPNPRPSASGPTTPSMF